MVIRCVSEPTGDKLGVSRIHILGAIGSAPLVQLRNVVPEHGARVCVKIEWENATGSMKDRMARAVISRAVRDFKMR